MGQVHCEFGAPWWGRSTACIGATINTCRDNWCHPYAGFLLYPLKIGCPFVGALNLDITFIDVPIKVASVLRMCDSLF